jgi:hypothetical protein
LSCNSSSFKRRIFWSPVLGSARVTRKKLVAGFYWGKVFVFL